MKQYVLISLYAILHASADVNGLTCLTCNNVTSPSQCHTTSQCGPNQNCYTRTYGDGDNTTISMGCKSGNECSLLSSQGTDELVGKRSQRAPHECIECCSSDYCNGNICNISIPSATMCLDDLTVNCQYLDKELNICADLEIAKLVCRKYCNLCQEAMLKFFPGHLWYTFGSDLTCVGSFRKERLITSKHQQYPGFCYSIHPGMK